MTEPEWLACTDPAPMLEFLRGKVSDRKLLLFCLNWRPTYYSTGSECQRYATAYRFADGDCGLEELRKAWILEDEDNSLSNCAFPEIPYPWAHSMARSEYQLASVAPVDRAPPLIREIFGNPFRPVTVDPRWQTETVIALAAGIYEDRAFERMPILADALQETGCENEQVLQHCREPGQHVRGCWVVDLLLGKQ